MSTTGKEYSDMAKKASPKSSKLTNCLKAFLIGGFICLIGQALMYLFQKSGFNEQETKTLTSVVLIVLTAILTGNLDSRSGEDVMKILKGLHEEGRTIILITHDNGIANQAKRVIRIQDGQIVDDYINK